jgi:hypothetical protein
VTTSAGGATAFFETEPVSPPIRMHQHVSSIVECSNGDLLVTWNRGTSERAPEADDTMVMGARAPKAGSGQVHWSAEFIMADYPDLPDHLATMVIDRQQQLRMFWVTTIADEPRTALLRYRVSTNYLQAGPPLWSEEGVVLLKPGAEFVEAALAAVNRRIAAAGGGPDRVLDERKDRIQDAYSRRMGWYTRNHPFILDSGRILLPLHSDMFGFSMVAITDDQGAHWRSSVPLCAVGNVQPSFVRKKDGTLVAFMRNNGPPPKRLMRSESRDAGATWSPVELTSVPNPGSSAEAINLRNGNWLLVYNDTERGRQSLAAALSDDEGVTWKWTRHIALDPAPNGQKFAYPSVIQSKDGSLHVTYSWSEPPPGRDVAGNRRRPLQNIRHVHFSVEWVMQGEQ